MAIVDGWFFDFFAAHTQRVPFFPWSAPGTADFDALAEVWERSFIRGGIRQEVADEASYRIAEEDVSWEKHLPRFLAIAQGIAREMNSTGQLDAPNSIEAARKMSADCLECKGTGLTARYRLRPVGNGLGMNAPGAAFTCYCNLCSMGRAVASNHREKCPDVAGGMIDLADPKWTALRLREIGDGRHDNPHCYRPGGWDFHDDVPIRAEVNYKDVIAKRGIVKTAKEALAEKFVYRAPEPQPGPAAAETVGDVPIY